MSASVSASVFASVSASLSASLFGPTPASGRARTAARACRAGARWVAAAVGVVGALAASAGCAPGGVVRAPSDGTVAPGPTDFEAVALAAGDVFEVRVYKEEALSGVFRVPPDGRVELPLIGEVRVAGDAPEAVAGRIRERLQDGFLRDPHVTVFVKEYASKKVFVLGQVQRPGTFPYEPKMNVVQAVTLAGGFTPTARRDDAQVTRKVDGVEVRIPVPVERISAGLAPNFLLRPGDIVFVPESLL